VGAELVVMVAQAGHVLEGGRAPVDEVDAPVVELEAAGRVSAGHHADPVPVHHRRP